jgi:hypothetical protein
MNKGSVRSLSSKVFPANGKQKARIMQDGDCV